MKRRRWLAIGPAVGVALAACNALLGNEEPSLADHEGGADAVGPDGARNDAPIGMTDAGGSADASDAEPVLFDAGCAPGKLCSRLAQLPDAVTNLSVSPDGFSIYWLSASSSSSASRLDRYDLVSGEHETIPLTALQAPTLLAAANDGVFVSGSTSAQPITFIPPPKSGLPTKTFNTGGSPTALAVSPATGDLVWADGTMIQTCSVLKGTCTPLTPSNGAVVGITFVGKRTIWLTKDGVVRNDAPANVDSAGQGGIGTAIGAGGATPGTSDGVVWSGKPLGSAPFVRRARDGGDGELTLLTGAATSLAGDDLSVYWVAEDVDSGATRADDTSIAYAPRNFSLPPEIVAGGQTGVAQIVISHGAAFWTRQSGVSWELVSYAKK